MVTVKKLELVKHSNVVTGWRVGAEGFIAIGRAMAAIDAAIQAFSTLTLSDANAIGWLKEAQIAARSFDEELDIIIKEYEKARG